jgi:hypothetical protein
LLDKGAIGFGKAVGQGWCHWPACAFDIALAVERRPFTGGERADPLDNRLDHVRAGGGKAIMRGNFGDPGVDLDGQN